MAEPRPTQCPNPELHPGHVSDDGLTWCAGLDGTEVPRPGSLTDGAAESSTGLDGTPPPPAPCAACVAVPCPSCRVPAGTACTVTRPDLYGPTHADRRELAHR